MLNSIVSTSIRLDDLHLVDRCKTYGVTEALSCKLQAAGMTAHQHHLEHARQTQGQRNPLRTDVQLFTNWHVSSVTPYTLEKLSRYLKRDSMNITCGSTSW